jgi:hypothetical protein
MDQKGFRSAARRLVLELIFAICLVSFGAEFPEDVTFATAWTFVVQHANLLLHVVIGTLILVESSALAMHSLKGKHRSWKVFSLIGLCFVLLAYGSGEGVLSGRGESALGMMTVGWLGAILVYATAWFKTRAKQKET